VRRWSVLGALTCVVLGLVGCGSHVPRAHGNRNVVLLADCSESTKTFRDDWIEQMANATFGALEAGKRISIDCVDGAPLTTMTFPITVDGSVVPTAYQGNATLVERYHRAETSAVERKLKEMFAAPHQRGSALLEGLEASIRRRPASVRLWTDALIIQLDEGIDVNRTPTPSELHEIVATWEPRLAGLRGVPVEIIGGGRGARRAASARYAHEVFAAVLAAAGVPFTWS
jgi:hypothetical protein